MKNLPLKKYFCGIDLGGFEKKTTGVCLLEKKDFNLLPAKDFGCRVVFGKEVFLKIKSYLDNLQTIAIDGPLSFGPGKGKMRLWEKFLSKKVFRQAKISPLPPILIKQIAESGIKIVDEFKKYGFSKDIDIIEVFPTFVLEVCGSFKNFVKKISLETKAKIKTPLFITSHEKSAFVCALIAFLYSSDKTRYLGYRDSFLHLPSFDFWQKNWQNKFTMAWKEKDYLKYRHLKTNIF